MPLPLKKESGFSLIELIVGTVVASVVAFMSLGYLHLYLKTIQHSEGYISQEETSHFIEKFFKNPDFCAETMKKAESSGIPGAELSIDLDLHAPSKAKGLFKDWKQNLNGDIEVSFFPLKNNMDLAHIQWTLSAKVQGDLQKREKSSYIEVVRDNQGKISNCLKSSESTQICKGGVKHILTYDQSSLNPITSSLIENPGPHGKSYKTLTLNSYDDGRSLSCLSHTYCHKGDWNNSLWCYNSCADSVYSTGDEKYRSLSSNKDCSGGSKQGQTVKCRKNKKSWCQAEVLSHPKCSIDLKPYCKKDKNEDPVGSYSPDMQAICQGKGRAEISGRISLPEGDYGDTFARPKEVSIKGNHFGYLSIYALCDYSGKWHIMGATCDKAPLTGETKNVWGRVKKSNNRCVPEYPSNKFSCSSGGNITLTPGISSDGEGPIPNKSIHIKEIYKHQIGTRVAHGAPLRFMYDFNGRSPTIYTAVCNSKTGRFEVTDKSLFCQAEDRSAKLDMVFVIDNSRSMKHEQENLAKNLIQFFEEFLNDEVDTHIAVVTTDNKNLLSGSFLCNKPNCRGRKASITQIQDRLKKAIKNAGTEGSQDERLFRPVMRIKSSLPGFFRSQAVLALYFLTDEDDYDNNHQGMIDFLFSSSKLNRNPQKTIAFIAVNDSNSKTNYGGANCENGIQKPVPASMRRFVNLMNTKKAMGYEVDLCDNHFGERMKEFGVQLSSLLQTAKPPQRPASLDALDTNKLPEPLKDKDTGNSLITCP